MARCNPHNRPEPCIYCERGVGSFENLEARIQMLEDMVRDLQSRFGNPGVSNIQDAIGVIRDCGVGDLIMLSPSLKALKEKNPKRPVALVTKPELFDLFTVIGPPGANLVPYLDALLPVEGWKDANFYKTYDLCQAVESVNKGGKLPLDEFMAKRRPDIFAEKLGVEPPKSFQLTVHPGAMSVMRGLISHHRRPFIGLAPTCRSPIRTIPPEYVEPLIDLLQEHYDGTVFLLGKTEGWNKHLAFISKPGVVNLLNKMTLKDMVAATSLMHVVIAPDTGSQHIAGGLGVKCLVVQANNEAEKFVNFYKASRALNLEKDEMACAPCNDQRESCRLKQGQYGADCMHLLTPKRIFEAVKNFYNGTNIAWVRDISMNHVGGAEITDAEWVKEGRALGYNIRTFDEDTNIDAMYDLADFDLIVLSNLWLFDKQHLDIIMKMIRKVPYIKVEHDHRSLEAKWREYSRVMFRDSLTNIFISPDHREDYRQGLGVDGEIVFPTIDLDLFRPVPGVYRRPKTALIGVPRKANMKELVPDHPVIKHAKMHQDIKFELLNRVVPFVKMPEVYSEYEYFVHLPVVKWSCERVIFEAALCGCKVVSNANAEGMSWGAPLDNPKALRDWIERNNGGFWKVIAERMQQCGFSLLEQQLSQAAI